MDVIPCMGVARNQGNVSVRWDGWDHCAMSARDTPAVSMEAVGRNSSVSARRDGAGFSATKVSFLEICFRFMLENIEF